MNIQSCHSPVLVWGGGTGGVAAALQAARSGAETLLLTPGRWLGGMVSSAGVCCPDGNELAPWQTGLWGAFLRALERCEPEGLDHNWVSCFGYRPTTAEAILQHWVQELPNLHWWTDCRLLEVKRSQALIQSVLIQRAGAVHCIDCEVAIDGSDRGDLLPLAQAPFRLGWEPQDLWGEPSAPSQQRLQTEHFFQEQRVQSPTWVVMGQLQSDRLEPEAGCSMDPDHRPVLPAPFERACEAFGLERTITYGRLPDGLVMLNWPLHGNDWHWGLERAFSGDPQQEADLFRDMQAHSLQFAEALSDASGGWLTLGHGFPAESGSPAPWLATMPYWREGRRMIGRTTVVEQDLLPQAGGSLMGPLPLNAAGELQSVAVGNYANDHHYPGPDWPLAPKSCRWGGSWTGTPFCIPYQALVSSDIDNLLAADKAFSTSHMANGATRLQPLIFNVGQAAGAAAALAVNQDRTPAELQVRSIQDALLHDSQAPSAVVPLWGTAWHHPDWLHRQQTALADAGSVLIGFQTGSDAQAIGVSPIAMESKAQPFEGRIEVRPDGSVHLQQQDGEDWPLITLEPEIDRWWKELVDPVETRLLARINRWGPWLVVVSRLA